MASKKKSKNKKKKQANKSSQETNKQAEAKTTEEKDSEETEETEEKDSEETEETEEKDSEEAETKASKAEGEKDRAQASKHGAQEAETSDTQPENAYQSRSLFGLFGVTLRGICMGGADVIPGVSGGTMALILGIYRELIASIRAFDVQALRYLLKGELRKLSAHINLPFLIFLGAGIFGAIISLAKIIPQLLADHPAPVHGLFFGLILASIFLVWNQVEEHSAITVLALFVGAIASYFLVGMIPVTTPNHLGFIFFAGSIAIIAMILPGISGAFILLLLGKYAFILQTLRAVVHERKIDQNLLIVVVFASGCVVGLLLFSRLLNWLLARHHALTLALLSGLMIGSLRRIWPFQTYVKEAIGKKVVVKSYTNFWPTQWNGEYLLAIVLILIGMLLVYTLHHVAQKTQTA